MLIPLNNRSVVWATYFYLLEMLPHGTVHVDQPSYVETLKKVGIDPSITDLNINHLYDVHRIAEAYNFQISMVDDSMTGLTNITYNYLGNKYQVLHDSILYGTSTIKPNGIISQQSKKSEKLLEHLSKDNMTQTVTKHYVDGTKEVMTYDQYQAQKALMFAKNYGFKEGGKTFKDSIVGMDSAAVEAKLFAQSLNGLGNQIAGGFKESSMQMAQALHDGFHASYGAITKAMIESTLVNNPNHSSTGLPDLDEAMANIEYPSSTQVKMKVIKTNKL